ncbi:hypothetical protein [Nostoc sp.]|uniref:hypothetical protein n=1 Tax=Nostoc sp. TaxID=1180 RepID=UPI002FF69BCF
MTTTYNLPDGPQMPRWLWMIKFISQPLKYVDDFAQTYGDTFTIRSNRSDNHLVSLFCHFPVILNKRIRRKNSAREVGQWM